MNDNITSFGNSKHLVTLYERILDAIAQTAEVAPMTTFEVLGVLDMIKTEIVVTAVIDSVVEE